MSSIIATSADFYNPVTTRSYLTIEIVVVEMDTLF